MTQQRRNTYFLSDMHLGASYIADPRAHENRVVSFLRSIENDARAVYLLGDVLDYWFEYRSVVPRGYVRFFGQLARMADAGIEIVWFTGNHDIWLFDYVQTQIGIEVIDAKNGGIERRIDGTLFFLGHGDDFGRQPLGYRMLRAVFHNRFCQWLYAGIHPRWTMPFAYGWSSHSRKGAERKPNPKIVENGLCAAEDEARRISMLQPDLRYVIIGHLHIVVDKPVTPSCRLVVLGNWIDQSTYAVFDGAQLSVKEYIAEQR